MSNMGSDFIAGVMFGYILHWFVDIMEAVKFYLTRKITKNVEKKPKR